MGDHLTRTKRSWNMSRIRSKNTAPEINVRRALHRRGYRYALHGAKLPGKPDLVLRRFRIVIFVHGCFWHRHRGCLQCTTPKSNTDYWIPKLDGNALRDARHRKALRQQSWKVIVIWACEANSPKRLARRLNRLGFRQIKATS